MSIKIAHRIYGIVISILKNLSKLEKKKSF